MNPTRLNTQMRSMVNSPIIFVTYPIGAGGWFLASLLNSAYTDTVDSIKHDTRGSGHDNTEISKLNNWYTSVQDNTIQDILYQKNISILSTDQRIEYLRKTLIASPQYNNIMTHVISLHCQDANLFLTAFPNSKAIIINITNDDIAICTFNFIYKVLQINLKYFETFCKMHGRDYAAYVNLLQSIDLSSLKKLQWIAKDIEMTTLSVPIDDLYNSRVLYLDYQDYIYNADPLELLQQLNDFLRTDWSAKTMDRLADEIVLYRLRQPLYPTN